MFCVIQLSHLFEVGFGTILIAVLLYYFGIHSTIGAVVFSIQDIKQLDKLSENLETLLTTKLMTDVTIVVNDKAYRAHRCILAARSPVFEVMLKSIEGKDQILELPDLEIEYFDAFLTYLYSGCLEFKNFIHSVSVYKIAQKYDVHQLKNCASDYFTHNLDCTNFFEVLDLAKKYEDSKVMKSVQEYFNHNLPSIAAKSEWKTLNENNFDLAQQLLTKYQIDANNN